MVPSCKEYKIIAKMKRYPNSVSIRIILQKIFLKTTYRFRDSLDHFPRIHTQERQVVNGHKNQANEYLFQIKHKLELSYQT